jgi:hypothetical protein
MRRPDFAVAPRIGQASQKAIQIGFARIGGCRLLPIGNQRQLALGASNLIEQC